MSYARVGKLARAISLPARILVDRRRVRRLINLRVMDDYYAAQKAWDQAHAEQLNRTGEAGDSSRTA